MPTRIRTVALLGIEARPVEVECETAAGLPGIRIIGLPGAAVRESVDRVRSAIERCGVSLTGVKALVNLAPADVRKTGTSFDLPIALAVLAALGEVPALALTRAWAYGEVGLDGRLRHAPGTLPAAAAARRQGAERLLVPDVSAVEAALVEGVEIVPLADLEEAVDVLAARRPVRPIGRVAAGEVDDHAPDLVDVRGQPVARRALEIAAAGGHHLLLCGPPGCGKSMLARRLPGLLPPLDVDDALEVAAIRSVAGLRAPDEPLDRRPPFEDPHHTTSSAGLIGGGSGVPAPGAVSRAHRGVLFVDELLELPRPVLDALREPLEHGSVALTRAAGTVRYPARVLLVGATNPCPCGYLGDERRPCRCRPDRIETYRARLSGPLLDRIDLQVQLRAVPRERLLGPADGEPSARVAQRVAEARGVATDRAGRLVRDTPMPVVRATATPAALAALARAVEHLALSVRSFDRGLRVARTIADLDRAERVETGHVEEALAYRLPHPVGVG